MSMTVGSEFISMFSPKLPLNTIEISLKWPWNQPRSPTVYTCTENTQHSIETYGFGNKMHKFLFISRTCEGPGELRGHIDFPFFMLWLWDYPFSHSFLKPNWNSSFFLFSPHPPTPSTHTHTPETHTPAQWCCTHFSSTAKSLLDPENCNSSIDHSCWILGLTKALK